MNLTQLFCNQDLRAIKRRVSLRQEVEAWRRHNISGQVIFFTQKETWLNINCILYSFKWYTSLKVHILLLYKNFDGKINWIPVFNPRTRWAGSILWKSSLSSSSTLSQILDISLTISYNPLYFMKWSKVKVISLINSIICVNKQMIVNKNLTSDLTGN